MIEHKAPTIICPHCEAQMLDGLTGTGETVFQCNDCRLGFIPIYKTWRTYTWTDEDKSYKHLYDVKMKAGF